MYQLSKLQCSVGYFQLAYFAFSFLLAFDIRSDRGNTYRRYLNVSRECRLVFVIGKLTRIVAWGAEICYSCRTLNFYLLFGYRINCKCTIINHSAINTRYIQYINHSSSMCCTIEILGFI